MTFLLKVAETTEPRRPLRDATRSDRRQKQINVAMIYAGRPIMRPSLRYYLNRVIETAKK
jgi:hypothetical protein